MNRPAGMRWLQEPDCRKFGMSEMNARIAQRTDQAINGSRGKHRRRHSSVVL